MTRGHIEITTTEFVDVLIAHTITKAQQLMRTISRLENAPTEIIRTEHSTIQQLGVFRCTNIGGLLPIYNDQAVAAVNAREKLGVTLCTRADRD